MASDSPNELLNTLRFPNDEQDYTFHNKDLLRNSSIGSGGFGQVFKCKHGPTKNIMAVKIIHCSINGTQNASNCENKRKLENEIRNLSSLASPYIVTFYGSGPMAFFWQKLNIIEI